MVAVEDSANLRSPRLWNALVREEQLWRTALMTKVRRWHLSSGSARGSVSSKTRIALSRM
jgi:hypothetical protein